MDLVTWKLLETLGKAVPLKTLGMKTRLVRVVNDLDEGSKVGNLDKSFNEFCLKGGQRDREQDLETSKRSQGGFVRVLRLE